MKIAGKFIKKALALSLSLATVIGIGFGTPLSTFTGMNVSANYYDIDHVQSYHCNNYRYVIKDDGTVAIIDCTDKNNLTTSTIPNTINGMTVTSIEGNSYWYYNNYEEIIDSGAFESCSKLTKVIIPNTVRSIDSSAFANCKNLTDVVMNNGLEEISNSAFRGCISLRNINIPNSVVSIGYSAFSNCLNLTNIVIPSSVNKIYSGAFSGCVSLTSVEIPYSVTDIEAGAFSGCKNLTIYGVKNSSAENYANSNNIPFVDINNIEIQDISFEKSSTAIVKGDSKILTTIITPSKATNKNITWTTSDNSIATVLNGKVTAISTGTATITAKTSNGKTATCNITVVDSPVYANEITLNTNSLNIANGTYEILKATVTPINSTDDNITWTSSDRNIVSVSNGKITAISAGTATITASINNGKTASCTVTIFNPTIATTPEELRQDFEIDNSGNIYILKYKDKKSEITVPNAMHIENFMGDFTAYVQIKPNAFDGCQNLKKVTIQSGMVVESGAFSNCPNLETVVFEGTVGKVRSGAFVNCPKLKNVILKKAFVNCNDSFVNCPNLTNIQGFPTDNYKVIDDVIYKKNSLDDGSYFWSLLLCPVGKKGVFTIPDDTQITSIDDRAFDSCSMLEEIKIGNNIKKIGDYAFRDCTNLKTINIPESITNIGNYIFLNCAELKNVNFQKSLSTIGKYWFQNCINLSDITLPASTNRIAEGAFKGCTKIENIAIPNKVAKIEKYAFEDCTSLKNIKIPDGVRSIAEWTFHNCTGLEEIDLPNSVTFLGGSAFNGCEDLKKIAISDNLTSVNASMFRECKSLQEVVLSNKLSNVGQYTFYNCSNIEVITIPNKVANIYRYAFANCQNLKKIYIPPCVSNIDKTAFENCPDVVIYGKADSYAQKFAGNNNIPFVSAYEITNNSELDFGMVSLGEDITVNVKLSDDNLNCKYLIKYKKKDADKWTVLQDYTTNKSVTFIPDEKSDYNMVVYAKDENGFIFSKSLSFKVTDEISNTSYLSTDTIYQGKSVAVNTKAENGNGKYTYAVFYKKKDESKWNTAQDFSRNTYISITPRFAGEYEILVKAKDRKGYIDEKILTVNVIEPFRAELKISDKNVFLGNSVTLTANATGGYGDYTYAFYYRKATDETWTTKQNFSTNNSIALKPAYETEYEICVKVKDKSGDLQKLYNKFNVSKVPPLTNTSVLTKSSINLGEYATVKCSSTGGIAPCQYAVYYKKKTDTNWTAKQSFSENTTVTFKPAKAVDYDVCIKAKDSQGTVSKKYLSLKVIQNNVVNTSALVSSSILLGSSATVKCSATSGTSPYQYAVYYKKENDPNWYEVQSFDENATVTFKPLKALTYNVCVKAKDKNNTVDKKYFTLNVTQPISNLSLNAYLASSNINKGDTAVAICSAKDGIEPYKYALYAKKSTSSYWSTIQDFNSNSVITYKPTDVGNYDICVKVKDNSSKVDKQYLTLTVK